MRKGAAVLLFVLALSALFPAIWTEADYDRQFRDVPDAPPSQRFLLGTDALGRDRLARLLHGARISLLLAPAAALLSCLVAATIGGSAAFFGGWAERVLAGFAELFLSLPWLFLLLVVRACLPLNLPPEISVTATFLLLGLLGWAAPSQVIRSAVKDLQRSDFVLHARAMGCRTGRILRRHLLPGVMPVLAAQFWVVSPMFIMAEATLGILGLGVTEPLPSLGGMLREIPVAEFHSQPWTLAPVALLAAIVGCFQIVLPRKDVPL